MNQRSCITGILIILIISFFSCSNQQKTRSIDLAKEDVSKSLEIISKRVDSKFDPRDTTKVGVFLFKPYDTSKHELSFKFKTTNCMEFHFKSQVRNDTLFILASQSNNIFCGSRAFYYYTLHYTSNQTPRHFSGKIIYE